MTAMWWVWKQMAQIRTGSQSALKNNNNNK